jgi:hypothetical protein
MMGPSTGTRGPGGYGAVLTWKGETEEISGGERDTTNLRMEPAAACAALETMEEGHNPSTHYDAGRRLRPGPRKPSFETANGLGIGRDREPENAARSAGGKRRPLVG